MLCLNSRVEIPASPSLGRKRVTCSWTQSVCFNNMTMPSAARYLPLRSLPFDNNIIPSLSRPRPCPFKTNFRCTVVNDNDDDDGKSNISPTPVPGHGQRGWLPLITTFSRPPTPVPEDLKRKFNPMDMVNDLKEFLSGEKKVETWRLVTIDETRNLFVNMSWIDKEDVKIDLGHNVLTIKEEGETVLSINMPFDQFQIDTHFGHLKFVFPKTSEEFRFRYTNKRNSKNRKNLPSL